MFIIYFIIRRDLIQNSNKLRMTNLNLDARISLHPHIVKQLEDLSNSENLKNENENENENEDKVESTWSHKKGVRRSMGTLCYIFALNIGS